MKNIKTFSLALAMLICNLSFSNIKTSNSTNYVVSQEKTISGKVFVNGKLAANVSIKIAGKNIEIFSNKAGKYRLKCNIGDQLICTHNGVQKQITIEANSYLIDFNFESNTQVKFKAIPNKTN